MSSPAAVKYAEREAKASPWDAKYYHDMRDQAVGDRCLEEDIDVAFLAKTLFSSVNALSSQNERRQEITEEKDEVIAGKERKISRRDNRIERRNNKIAERDQKITSLTTDTLNLQEKINDAESKNAQLIERIRDQDRQNQILVKAFKDKKSEVEKKDLEISQLKEQNEQLSEKNVQSEKAIDEQRKNRGQLQEIIKTKTLEISSKEIASRNEIANLTRQIEKQDYEIANLKKENASLAVNSEGEHKKRIENLEAQNNQLQNSVEEMKKMIQSVVQDIAILRQQNTAKDLVIAEKDSIIKALTETSQRPFGFEEISDSN